MRNAKRALAVVGLSFGIISVAHADWQYTRWGMTEAEVVKASRGQAIPNPQLARTSTEVELAKLTAPYTTGAYNFEARFMFNRSTDKLTGVRLNLSDASKCIPLYHELVAKYGKPLSESNTSGMRIGKWQDRPSNMTIAILDIGQRTCEVMYGALVSANNKGL
jgi:hypothetical protein